MLHKRQSYRLSILSLLVSSHIVTIPVQAADTTEHPIDKTLTACMEKDSTTVGMKDCLVAAQKQWDTELNRVYTELMAKLNKKGQTQLKKAQLQWLKYRDAEFAAIDALYEQQYKQAGGGTIWGVMHLSSRGNVVKERTLALQELLNTFSEN